MARQAEAARDRRARVINADAELQASRKLAEAAAEMAHQPAALQLRLLQTVTAVAAEKNSTLVLPFPVELLRFLERAAPVPSADAARDAGRVGTGETRAVGDGRSRPASTHDGDRDRSDRADEPVDLGPGPMIDPLAESHPLEWSDSPPTDEGREGDGTP
jgi:hypothetical protein